MIFASKIQNTLMIISFVIWYCKVHRYILYSEDVWNRFFQTAGNQLPNYSITLPKSAVLTFTGIKSLDLM
jgi:hypothetical protein